MKRLASILSDLLSQIRHAVTGKPYDYTSGKLIPPIIPDYSSRKHKMSKRALHVESDQRVTGYPQKTDGIRPG